ncbi:MAG TPA: hypothetical protein VD834_13160 [Blastococcus sp.]|nr:hypothetical protein [Blastococcus sp.]
MVTDSSLSARHRTADVRPRAAAPGIALAVGGAMVVASEVVMLGLETGSVSAAGITTKIVRLAAFLLVLLGLPGLYALRRHGAGRIWGAAYVTAYLGTALIAGDLWFEAFAYPFLIEAAPALTELTPSGTFIAGALASFVLFLCGWAAIGIAGLRNRELPRAPSALLILGAAVGFPSPLYEPRLVPWGLAVAWLGLHMARSDAVGT